MAGDINKKQAPQQLVVDIQRTGGWGNVEYRHRLECGHTEVRKRVMQTKTIACASCVLALKMDGHTGQLQVRKTLIIEPLDVSDVISEDTYGLGNEIDINRAQAALASKLGVPVESVDVISEVGEDGMLQISYATVFIEASVMYRLLSPNEPSQYRQYP